MQTSNTPHMGCVQTSRLLGRPQIHTTSSNNSMKHPRTSMNIPALCCLLGALSTPAALAVVVEDFESYSTGDGDVTATPPWTMETPGSSSVAEDGGNQFLTFSGPGDWTHHHRPSTIPITNTGSFSIDVYITVETDLDHAFGLAYSAGDEPPVDWYQDYGSYVRVTDDGDGANGTVSLDVRDGGGFVDDIASLNLNEWYTIRLDNIDTASGGSFDVSVDGIGSVHTGAGFRQAFDSDPLDTVLLMAGNGAGSGVRVDNINVVPEPSVALLGTLGMFGLIRRRR